MTTYTYRYVLADGRDGALFELEQPFGANALSTHPENGRPIRRTIESPPAIGNLKGDRLSDDNLARTGFTKYKKEADGRYGKVCGSGPDMIER
jgi:hypothetical protein